MASNKKGIQSLVSICEQKGLRNVIISPGSRNAPLSITFDENDFFRCFQITDERVAAFFAMGMAQRTGQASIICCTSGTAVLNYAPAIAEAYYQRIPLIVLTADRPIQWIDQGAGQSMRQQNVYANYILESYTLPQRIETDQDLWYNDRIINEAINLAHGSVHGPVHINIPLEEPLYDQESVSVSPKLIHPVSTRRTLTEEAISELQNIWKSTPRKMIICGMLPKDPIINMKINDLSHDPSVVVLTETHSNVSGDKILPCIDRIIETIQQDAIKEYTPELLISFGHSIISKKVKALLAKMKVKYHWHIDGINHPNDTFRHLTHHIKMDPADFLVTFIPERSGLTSDFYEMYNVKETVSKSIHDQFIRNAPFSDLKVFSVILPLIPRNGMLQMGNSASVRYVQLFNQRTDVAYYANRGVSGIDGCTSTACGAAFDYDGYTTLITGDISFLYDSNGLWHDYVHPNLRIIVINNQGGGIFRFIDGPSRTKQLDKYFEAHHHMTAKGNAEKFDLFYESCDNEQDLRGILENFYEPAAKAKILEIFTPRELNDQVLKDYFRTIRNQKL